MTTLRVSVSGVGLWMSRYPDADAWASRATPVDGEPAKPKGEAYSRVNRRRASQMGRAIGDAVSGALAQAGAEPSTTPVIVGSSIGEASAMIGLLDQMWRAEEPMSPAVFTVSVHNAASGLLSISMKNKGFTTSIAADYDTPAAVLLEGIGLIATGHETVCCVCADEDSPRSLLEHAPHWDMLAGAVVLTRADTTGDHAQLAIEAGAASDLAPAEVAEAFTHNPQVGMLDLIDALQRGATGALRLDRGKGRGYVAHLHR